MAFGIVMISLNGTPPRASSTSLASRAELRDRALPKSSVRPGSGRAAFEDPYNIVGQWRLGSQLFDAGGVLSTMVQAVQDGLKRCLPESEAELTGEPGYNDLFIQSLGGEAVQEWDHFLMVASGDRLQVGERGLLIELFSDIYRLSIKYFQKTSLHDVKVNKPVVKLFIAQRRGAGFDCSPMLGISPLLMCIKIAERFQHEFDFPFF
jgi:hypothetical protein